MLNFKITISLLVFLSSTFSVAGGNTRIESFSKAKKIMQRSIFVKAEDRKTLYCGASFDLKKNVTLPKGFTSSKYKKRQKKWEAEHIVSAHSFGHVFSEWRDGHPKCVDRKGRSFKGRNCASKINRQYRLMQADLHGLYPAIGSVNAMRSNYNFTLLPGEKSDFGACEMKIENRKAEPPIRARGVIARAYLYFDETYPFSMSRSQRNLMNAWNKEYPVSAFECRRNAIIKKIQGNDNPILRGKCQ